MSDFPTQFSEQEILNRAFNATDNTLATSGAAASDGAEFTEGSSEGTPAMGVYEATPTTVTDNDLAIVGIDANRNQKVREQFAPTYEDNAVGVAKVEQRYSNTYISTATTTTVKSGSGLLHCITVNGGTAGTIIIYDNTAASGTILASFDSTNAIATYMFNCTFSTGLTVVTGAATKISVNWR